MRYRFVISGFVATALFVLCCAQASAHASSISKARITSATIKSLGKCAWSFFGDPRSLAHGNTVITACVSGHGNAYVIRENPVTQQFSRTLLFHFSEADDHDNPSLIFWHKRLCAFFSPHSGHKLPVDRRMFMDFRCSLRPYGLKGGFGRPHRVPLPKGCGLGYTYPNLVKAGGRLYLFMRGPCWEPYYTSTTTLRRWAPPRTLAVGPHGMRPYAKYAGGPDGSIHMVFSDAHPQSYSSSLRYMRMHNGRFYRADGSLIGTLRDLPFKTTQLNTVYRHNPAHGKAWPMDITIGADGNPVIAYTLLTGGDTYWYARWYGHSWHRSVVSSAGKIYGGYYNSGMSLNHSDPSWVVFGKNDTGIPEIVLGHTPDGGLSWQFLPVTSGSKAANYRPIFPREFNQPGQIAIEFVRGVAPSFWTFDSEVIKEELPTA
jgi:hypothetical protein